MALPFDPVSAGATLGTLALDVYKKYCAVEEQIQGWGKSKAILEALGSKVKVVASGGDTLQSADLAAKGKALHTQLNDALRIVEDLQTSLNGSSCLKWCWNWCSHKAAVDAAKDALENVNRAADDYIVVINTQVNLKQHTHQEAAERTKLLSGIEAEVDKLYQPSGFMLFCEQQLELLGDGYPLKVMALPQTDQDKQRMIQGMRHTKSIWKPLQYGIEEGLLDYDGLKRYLNLVHRARKYRLLVEPIDICNWYDRRKHLTGSGHYIDGITPETEMTAENHKRPGRYRVFQEMEQRVLGQQPTSSLGLAYKLKQQLATDKPLTHLLGNDGTRQLAHAYSNGNEASY